MEICGVCRDELEDATQIQECGHIFCFRCIVEWANTSNTCPLCQRRFLKLRRIASKHTTKVTHVDHREENALRVLEQFDSEDQSVEDDEEEEEDWGSEADYYEEDFVVPDGIIIDNKGNVWDHRAHLEVNPFGGRVKHDQADCTFVTQQGKTIVISWNANQKDAESDYESSIPSDEENDVDEDSEYSP
jgi:hypothetical protein